MPDASNNTRDLYISTIYEAIMQLTEFNELYRNLMLRLSDKANKKDDSLTTATIATLEQIRRTEGHAFKRLSALSTKFTMDLGKIIELRKVLAANFPDRTKLDDLVIAYHTIVIDKFDLTLPTSNIQQVSQMTGSANEPRT